MKTIALVGAAAMLSACVIVDEHHHSHEAPEATEHAHTHTPPPGSNEMLRAAISGVEGLEVIISDVVIPPGAEVPRHYHPGEEFVYVIEGDAIHVEEGQPDRVLKAGDAMVIRPEAVHAPRGGEKGARAIVFRVHKAGQPERILVEETN